MGTSNDGPNWGNLVAKGRAKAIGVPWSDEELAAVYTLKIPADYVRRGCLTLKELEEMKEEDAEATKEKGEAPLETLKKPELLEKARKLGIDATEQATKADLIDLIRVAEEKRDKSPDDEDNEDTEHGTG